MEQCMYHVILQYVNTNSNGTLIATIGRDVGTMTFKPDNCGIAVKGDMIYVANSGEGKIIQINY